MELRSHARDIRLFLVSHVHVARSAAVVDLGLAVIIVARRVLSIISSRPLAVGLCHFSLVLRDGKEVQATSPCASCAQSRRRSPFPEETSLLSATISVWPAVSTDSRSGFFFLCFARQLCLSSISHWSSMVLPAQLAHDVGGSVAGGCNGGVRSSAQVPVQTEDLWRV